MKGYISVVLAILLMTTSSMLIATAGARSIHNVENFDLVVVIQIQEKIFVLIIHG